MEGSDYVRGWDDCLDIVASIIYKGKTIKEIREKLEYLHVLIKEKKLENIKEEFRILEDFF